MVGTWRFFYSVGACPVASYPELQAGIHVEQVFSFSNIVIYGLLTVSCRVIDKSVFVNLDPILKSAGKERGHVLATEIGPQAVERRWGAAEKEVQSRMRVFARYLPKGAAAALADSLLLESRLRARIQVLCCWHC